MPDPALTGQGQTEITAPHRAEVAALCARIDALQGLLVCYRLGDKRPAESLFKRLDNTKKVEMAIRERHGVRPGHG